MLETRLQQCQEHLVWQKQYNEKVSVDNIETTAQLPQSLDKLPLSKQKTASISAATRITRLHRFSGSVLSLDHV